MAGICLKYGGGDLDILLVMGEYRRKETLQLIAQFNAKRIIAPFSLKNIFRKNYDRVFYHKWHKHREVWRSVQIVRHINPKYFDKSIANLNVCDFKIQTLPQHKTQINNFLAPYNRYKFIVGVNAFGNTAYKFAPQDFAILAKTLAQKYHTVLFIMMSFEANLVRFKPFDEPNIAIWENDNESMNLIELTSRLNLLISPDTGNVHIADIFEVPILQTMKANLALKWGGGSYGNECQMLILKDSWIYDYAKLKARFCAMADEMIDRLLTAR